MNPQLSPLASLVGPLTLGIPPLSFPVGWDHRPAAPATQILHGLWGSKVWCAGLRGKYLIPPESSSLPYTAIFDSVNDIATVTNRQTVCTTGWIDRAKRWPAGEGADSVRAHAVLRLISLLKTFELFL